jgi:hypothetical protein
MPATPCPSVVVSKERIDPCLSFVSAMCDAGSVLRSLSASSMCASAIGMLAERCTAPVCTVHPPQYVPQAPPFPMPRELSYQEAVAASMLPPPPGCMGGMCSYGTLTASLSPEVVPCTAPMPTVCAKSQHEGKICIRAKPSGSQLEMTIGDNACLECKKMTIKLADNEIVMSRFDDRVRVHGADLKAMADTVRSEGKDRLILEGEVVLHYKKDGQSANVSGDCVELNLATGAMTIRPSDKSPR